MDYYSVILYGLLSATVVYLFIAAFALRHQQVEGSWNFSAMMIATAIYSIGYYFQLQSADEQIAASWIRFQYLGANSIPAFWLIFAIQYCGWGSWLTPLRFVGIWIIPISTILISNTIYVDQFLYTNIQIEFINGLTIVTYDRLLGFYIFYAYTILSVLVGMVILIYSYLAFKQDPNSKRFLLLFIGVLVPWVTYIAYGSSNSPLNLDINPVLTVFSAGVFIYNTYYFNMFRSVSIAKKVVFDAFKDAIVITNEQNRIVDMNPRATQYFGEMGRRIGTTMDDILSKVNKDGIWELEDKKIWFDIQWSQLEDSPRGNQARIYVFRDVTKQIETQQELIKSEEKYRTLFDNMQEGFALHEIICNEIGQPVDYRFLDMNRAYEKMMGLLREDSVNRRVLELFPETEKYWIESYGKVALRRTSISFENYSQGVNKYFSVNAFSPRVGQFAVICFDISDRILLEKATIEEKERLRTTLLSVGDGVIVTDQDANVFMINEVAQKLTGYSEAEAQGKPFVDIFYIIDAETGEECSNPVMQVFQSGKVELMEAQTTLVAKDGTKTQIADSAAPIKDEDGSVRGVVIVFRDVTEELKNQENIKYISYHDQLTGLYNRRYFEEQLVRLDTKRNLPFSIIIIDVNGLKLINDAFGHAIGDQLIQKSAEVIRKSTRADEIIARWGGDEFAVLLPSTTAEQTQEIVRRIHSGVKETHVQSAVLSLAVGWSTKQNESDEMQEIFKKAEDHMYRQKLLDSPKAKQKMVATLIDKLYKINEQEKGHAERVSELCTAIARQMKLSEKEIDELSTAAQLHDIGKVAIDPKILNKTETLTLEDWIEIKRHPEIGYRILSSVKDLLEVAEIVLAHHEHWDGTGYPRRLKGDKIPIKARILLIAEAFDSMTNNNKYRKALSKEQARKELKKHAGKQFDPEIVDIFNSGSD